MNEINQTLISNVEKLQSNQPPYRILMGPGPSNLHPRVLAALSKPIIGHLDPHFIELMNEVQHLLRYAFQTENKVTFPISAPGSTGMECSLINLLEPGEKIIIAINGVFGNRMQDIAKRCGAVPVIVNDEWGNAISIEKIEAALKENTDAKVLAFVHAETSTGALSDAKALCALAAKHGCLSVIDAVTSLAGVPVLVDEWGADVVYSGTQKCLSCIPGLSPITFSNKAITAIKERKTQVQSWFLDINLILGYWEGGGGKRAYHHTAPINPIYALHEALLLLKEETLQKSWQRHTLNHQALKAGLKTLGIQFLVEEESQLPQLNSVIIPSGVDEATIRNNALKHFMLEIGAGLGTLAGKVWRIGLMGHTSGQSNVLYCVTVLEALLEKAGHKTSSSKTAQSAVLKIYNN